MAVYGIGINDVPNDCKRKNENFKIYDSWKHMLERCYCEKLRKKHPSYIGVTVCEEWKIYSNYKEWYLMNYKENYFLDKDLIGGSLKLYSPETCAFIPLVLNNCLLEGASTDNNLPMGVKYKKKHKDMNNELKKPFYSTTSTYNVIRYLGYYETPEEAHKAWQIKKRDYLIELIESFKNEVCSDVIKSLQVRVDLLQEHIDNDIITKSLHQI